MSDHDDFYKKVENLVEDLDDLLGEYQILEVYDIETEMSEAREFLSDILYKMSRM